MLHDKSVQKISTLGQRKERKVQNQPKSSSLFVYWINAFSVVCFSSLTCSLWPSCSALSEFCFGNHGDLSHIINTGQSVQHTGDTFINISPVCASVERQRSVRGY